MAVTKREPTVSPIRQVRMSMRSSPDPRVARTRRAILDAVHVLVEREAGAITVGDIVAQAQISRSSFYTQFAGIDELALSVLSEALDELRAGNTHLASRSGGGPGEATRLGMTGFVRHIEEHRALYASVLSLPFTYLTYTRFVDALAAHIAESMEAAGFIGAPRGVRATSVYVAGGLLALLRLWLHGDLEGAADEIVEELMDLLPPALGTPQ